MSLAEVDDALTVLNGKAIGKSETACRGLLPMADKAVLHFEIGI